GLVVTTVVLNSILFEGNMAVNSGSELSRNEIANLMQITMDEIRNAYRNVTNPGQDPTKKFDNFTSQTRNFATNLTKLYAFHGAGVNITWDISNWDLIYANFSEKGIENSATNWTVMESVKNISIFELKNVSGLDFEINVTNQTTGSFLWSMKLNPSNSVSIKNSSGYVNNYAVDFLYINILNSTWGTHRFSTNVGNNISKISFLNGLNGSGRFNITGNTSYGRNFTRARDFIFNATVSFSASKVHANITIPVSVPW
ncbi:MAG: hypothetical protein O8C60_05685, partial [Candidatus Methanoperedens sp.]|nr:hypothetical protein [Candidatus Methanoperedens sp.]